MSPPIACAWLLLLTTAADPLHAVQRRYPVHRVTVTTTSGTVVYYAVPADAPASLRRAYRVLELAEREVMLSEALQLLELEYVNNERRLEALRTASTASYLTYLTYPNTPPQGPVFSSGLLYPPPEPAIKWALTADITRTAAIDRALAAIDRLTAAEYLLQQTWLSLAYPGRVPPPQLQLPAPPPPAQPPAPAAAPAVPVAPPVQRVPTAQRVPTVRYVPAPAAPPANYPTRGTATAPPVYTRPPLVSPRPTPRLELSSWRR